MAGLVGAAAVTRPAKVPANVDGADVAGLENAMAERDRNAVEEAAGERRGGDDRHGPSMENAGSSRLAGRRLGLMLSSPPWPDGHLDRPSAVFAPA
jgi:hypothetical protein